MQGERPTFANSDGGAGIPMGPQTGSRPVNMTTNRGGGFTVSSGAASQSQQQKPTMGWTSKFFDLLISVSLVALFAGLPLFFTGVASQGIVFEKQLYFYFWLLVGAVSWVSKGVLLGEMKIRRTPIDIPILLFVLVYGISVLFSVDRWHSFWGSFGDPTRGFLPIAGLAIAYYLLMSHFTPSRLRYMFGALVASSSIVVIWSLLAIMNISFLPEAFKAYAPLSLIGTMSTLTMFLSAALPLFMTAIFAAFSGSEKKSWRQLLIVGVMLVVILMDLFLLLALYPFVAWTVVLGGLGFFLIFILAQIVRPPEQWVWVPMVVFVIALSFFMVGQLNITKANLPVEVLPKLAFSWDIAKDSVANGNFLLGSGPSSYGYVFSLYRPVEYNQNTLYTLRFDQAPGIFLEALSTIGVLGVIVLLVLAFSFMSVGIYLLSGDKTRSKLYSLGLWGVSVMFFIASFLSAFNGSLILIGALVASLSLAALLWESGSEERYLSLSLKASPKFALALAFVFMVVSAGVAFLFAFIGKAFFADIAAGGVGREQVMTEESLKTLDRSATLYSNESQYLIRLGQANMVLANQEAAKPREEGDPNKVVNYVRSAIAWTERAASLSPKSVRAAESLGLIYENSGVYASDAYPKAIEAYEKALALEPNNPLLYVKIGQIRRAMADQKQDGEEKMDLYRKAKESFEAAIEKKKDLAVAHYSLSVALSRMKEYDAATEAASQAIRIDPNNFTYRYGLGALYQSRKAEGDLDKAEAVYKDILKANDKLIDVRLALGLLYEEKKDRNGALAEYRKIMELLPEGDQSKALRDQVSKFIDTVESGKSNIAKNSAPEVPAAPASETTPAGAENVQAPQGPSAPAPATTPAAPVTPAP